jgi:outer membrane protein OmpA-like peptidoglycan-associated protein
MNTRKLFTRLYAILLVTMLTVSWASSALGQNQDQLKETLFGATDKKLVKVQSEQGNLLSPANFKNAMNRYNEALEDLKNKKNIADIEKKLAEVNENLDKCLEVAKLGHITFATTMKAREDALKANAPQYSKEQYEQAEAQFISAAKKLERGDVKGAKKNVFKIDDTFRTAELNAIKVSIIGNVRNLMKEAKDIKADDYTPITYANAQTLLNEAEAILNANRGSETSAKEKAEAAEIEAKHAIFLSKQIIWLKKNQKEWENFILDREILIEELADALGFKATFEEGLDKPLRNSVDIARALQNEKKELVQEVDEQNKQLKTQNDELQVYREKEQGLQAELRDKQYRLEQKRRKEELLASIESLFSGNEATVLRKGEELIIRLIGLSFPSGKSTIQPEYYSLLAKVQRALRKFPNSPLTIEGHTDSVGDDRYNENLSYARASSVKKYLMANMGYDETRLTALGYGESRPVASNESKNGRAQNRRIDIVITYNEELL